MQQNTFILRNMVTVLFVFSSWFLCAQNKDSLVNFSNGVVKFNEGNYPAAVIELKKAIEINPKNSEAYFYLGEICQLGNDSAKAMEYYNLALEMDTTNSKAYKGRGRLKARLGDFRGSIDDFDTAIKYNVKFTDAYFNRGLSYLNLKEYKLSMADFTKVISYNPKDYQAYAQRGTAKFKAGDNKGACKDWSKAGELGDFTIYETIKKNCK